MDYCLLKKLVFLGVLFNVVSSEKAKEAKPEKVKKSAAEDLEGHLQAADHHDSSFDLGVIFGSIEEIESFNNLTKEEAQQKIREYADRIDLDKDGLLSVEELQKWVSNSLKTLDTEMAKERFTEVDSNKDGKFEWSEYLKDAFGVTPDQFEKMDDNQKEDHSSDLTDVPFEKEKFDLADKNKDGHLDASEYGLFLFPQADPEVAEAEARRIFNHADHNKDKLIELNEYFGADLIRDTPKERDDKKADFTRQDKDQDGKLTFEEYKAAIMPDYDTLAKKEAKHLIDEGDKNKDGKLSKEELAAQYHSFEGGQIHLPTEEEEEEEREEEADRKGHGEDHDDDDGEHDEL